MIFEPSEVSAAKIAAAFRARRMKPLVFRSHDLSDAHDHVIERHLLMKPRGDPSCIDDLV